MAGESTDANPTRWSLIVRAQGSGAEKRVALQELIGNYDGFVIWLIRRRGHPPDVTAEELKQDFLEGVVRRDDIAKLNRERGSFRGWLTNAVRRFLCNEWDKWHAARGGRKNTEVFELEPTQQQEGSIEDELCSRQFATHVVLNALVLQRREARDKRRFDSLVRFLPGPQMELVELGPLARTMSMTPTTLAKAICVLRARFRELLRDAVRDTLDLGPTSGGREPSAEALQAISHAVDDELRELRRHCL
jgi:RNA polymerase sigma-70 factor (ECF subfamily)